VEVKRDGLSDGWRRRAGADLGSYRPARPLGPMGGSVTPPIAARHAIDLTVRSGMVTNYVIQAVHTIRLRSSESHPCLTNCASAAHAGPSPALLGA
jgi:hypothetical protein